MKTKLIVITVILISILAFAMTKPEKSEYQNWLGTNIGSTDPMLKTMIISSPSLMKEKIEKRNFILFDYYHIQEADGASVSAIGLLNHFILVKKSGTFFSETLTIEDVKWLLSEPDATYQTTNGENSDYFEYAFNAGSLRIYASAYDGRVFGLFADLSKYPWLKQASSSERDIVYKLKNYCIMVPRNPIEPDTFTMIKSRSLKVDTIEKIMGKPSYRAHIHGIGHYVVSYLPEGLCFIGGPNMDSTFTLYPYLIDNPDITDLAALTKFNYSLEYADYINNQNEMIKEFAVQKIEELMKAERALEQGIVSPNKELTAGYLSDGGYWEQWIVIKDKNRPEVRVNAEYFIEDYKWLNNETLLYVTMMGQFFSVDAKTGRQKQIYEANIMPTSFVVSGNKIICRDYTGETLTFEVPFL